MFQMERDQNSDCDNGHIRRQPQPGKKRPLGSTVISGVGVIVVEQQRSEKGGRSERRPGEGITPGAPVRHLWRGHVERNVCRTDGLRQVWWAMGCRSDYRARAADGVRRWIWRGNPRPYSCLSWNWDVEFRVALSWEGYLVKLDRVMRESSNPNPRSAALARMRPRWTSDESCDS